MSYEKLTETTRAAVDQIVDEFYHNGKDAAAAMFSDYVTTCKLKKWEGVALGEIIRKRLAALGYLEIKA